MYCTISLYFSTVVNEQDSARSSKYSQNSKSLDVLPLNIRALLDIDVGMALIPLVVVLDMVEGGGSYYGWFWECGYQYRNGREWVGLVGAKSSANG